MSLAHSFWNPPAVAEPTFVVYQRERHWLSFTRPWQVVGRLPRRAALRMRNKLRCAGYVAKVERDLS